MPKNLLYLLVILLNWLLPISAVQAQPTPSASFCGTRDLTPRQARDLVQEGDRALRQKMASTNGTQPPITYVPIRPHIIRQSNGTGGYTLASLNQVMALTNSYYLLNGSGIQFYFAGSTPDYIDNDDMYNGYNGQSVDAYDAPNAMNQYYINQFTSSGLGGYSYYPANGLFSTRSFILDEHNVTDMGNRLVPHELGHNFNLIHTFGQNGGSGPLGSGVSTELVTRENGANCSTDGDLICDTPADPFNMNGASYVYTNGCVQYDPNSTARDANGAAYVPSTTNIMSYYYPCAHDFTPGQYDRIQAALALRQTHTAYTLDAPATSVTAPGNLTGTVSGNTIVLTWQDNAANEMGYFIERSTSPDGGFVAVAGVEPNVSVYVDDKVVLNTPYYYRIRPSNTTTGSLSNTFSIRYLPFLTPTTTDITGTTAQLNWSDFGPGITYDLQWRVVGASSWNLYSSLSGFTTRLYGLSVNTTYEWQVRITGSGTYTDPVRFTTTCPVPTPNVAYPSRTMAYLSWQSGFPEAHRLQWRPGTSTDWITVNGISSTYYSLTGLTSNTTYEWRVQGTCPGSTSIVTDFSPVQSFTTLSCPVPTLQLSTNSSTAVSLYWSTNFYETGRLFALRYRPTGTSNWLTIDQIRTGEYTPYPLNGLTPNVTYEAQVESLCSATEHSAYSSVLTFTPACQKPVYLYSSVKAYSAKLQWTIPYTPEAGATFDLQYRPSGTTDWLTVSNIVSASGYATTTYSLTGLSSNTTYEWRVRNNCPSGTQSDYTTGTPFSTVCLAPNYASWSLLSTTAVNLQWSATIDPGTLFDVRYRVVGASDWTTRSHLVVPDNYDSFVYSLTGLTNNTTYEWSVRTVCSPTDNSAYVSGAGFTTGCQIPGWVSVSPKTTSAFVSWPTTGASTYDLRYRRFNATDWTTISGLTSNSTITTGLQTYTAYEWQVRSNCGDGIFSNYSGSTTLSTAYCSAPYNPFISQLTPTSARLNWSYYYADDMTVYQVRYRVVGSPDWITLNNLTGSGTSISVVLTNLTTDSAYEWQAKSFCSPTESSAFSQSFFFQTCSSFYTLQDGDWSDPTIWSCHRVPTSGDVVQIKHTVSLSPYYTASALRVAFDPGKQLNYGAYAKIHMGQ